MEISVSSGEKVNQLIRFFFYSIPSAMDLQTVYLKKILKDFQFREAPVHRGNVNSGRNSHTQVCGFNPI